MTETKQLRCPVFPDMICPQGQEMSEACTVRINGNFDPLADFRDHLLLHCAIYQSSELAKKHEKEDS